MKSIEPSRHAEDRNWFESILRKIPGFHGYLEKEYRRESDQLVRDHLAERLQKSKRGLDEYMQALVAAGTLDGLDQGDRVRARLDRLIAGIRGAMQGYSGVFDFVRVDEGVLDDIYEHDMLLMQDVDQLAESIESAAGSTAPPQDVFPELLGQIDETQRRLDERGELLKGLSEG